MGNNYEENYWGNDIDVKVLTNELVANRDFWEEKGDLRFLEITIFNSTWLGTRIDLEHEGKRVCLMSPLSRNQVLCILETIFVYWFYNIKKEYFN